MSVRAKFYVTSIEDYGTSKKVNLQPVYQGPLSEENEDSRFTKATPSGALWMTIDNPKASIQFEPGKRYYLDFTEAAE